MSGGGTPSVADVPAYPAELESDVLLSDGRTAHLRPIRPDDADALRDFGTKLSAQTVYFRFFSPRRALSDREIQHFVTVDYRDRLALVAFSDGELVAVARYDRPAEEGTDAPADVAYAPGSVGRDEAEVAFVVRDDHQGRGLGMVMLEHLASAAVARGIGRFVADALPENHRMLGVFRAAGFEEHAKLESGVVRVTMELSAGPQYLERVDEREWRATVRSIERILRPSTVAVIGAARDRGVDRPRDLAQPAARRVRRRRLPGEPGGGDRRRRQGLRQGHRHPGPGRPRRRRRAARRGRPGGPRVRGPSGGGPRDRDGGIRRDGVGGSRSERELVRLARSAGMRVVGPNCMGVINTSPAVRLNATFAGDTPVPGRVGFLSQSGALGIAILGEAARRGIGISSFVSVGNKADVSGNDLLHYWERDPETDVILLYLESFGNPRRFSRTARRVAHSKPIVAVKSARTASGQRGAASHTAALASSDEAADALFRQAGVIRVETLEELFDVAELLSRQPLPAGRRVAIVGNAGGPGVLAADACESHGLVVPELSAATQARLAAVVPDGAAVGNPVDLIATVPVASYRAALEIVLEDDGIDAAIVVFAPSRALQARSAVEAVAEVAASSTKPILANLLVTDRAAESLRDAPQAVPWFAYPESAARALARVVPYAEWLREDPGAVRELAGLDEARAEAVVRASLAAPATAAAGATPEMGGRPTGTVAARWLDMPAAFDLLGAYGVDVLAWRLVADADAARSRGGRARTARRDQDRRPGARPSQRDRWRPSRARDGRGGHRCGDRPPRALRPGRLARGPADGAGRRGDDGRPPRGPVLRAARHVRARRRRRRAARRPGLVARADDRPRRGPPCRFPARDAPADRLPRLGASRRGGALALVVPSRQDGGGHP